MGAQSEWQNQGVVLIILHHHFRPGGVRRVIEMVAPRLVAHKGAGVSRVVLATGEAPDSRWFENFRTRLGTVSADVFVRAELGYISELKCKHRLKSRLKGVLAELFRSYATDECVVWAHNLGLGRNLHLAAELAQLCENTDTVLISHHHDWWFENRWHHYSSLGKPRAGNITAIADAVFPRSRAVRHVAINSADAAILAKHFGKQAAWLPNPVDRSEYPGAQRVQFARQWLKKQLGTANAVWLMPCRMLRRKNVAEGILLARWLRPEAWLVTTGGVSSAEEQQYADRLVSAAVANGWRARFGILQANDANAPRVVELMAASETILLTSLQEGFGLTYLEAAVVRRPLLARRLSNVAPDLAQFGFRFPYYYDDILIDPSLFDWRSEYERQCRLYARWKRQLPLRAQRFAGEPVVVALGPNPRPVPFSKLTLTAQLEVLSVPLEESWTRSAILNPFLSVWRDLASKNKLIPVEWPAAADRWLGQDTYAKAFLGLLRVRTKKPRTGKSESVQNDFFRAKLKSENLFPILWESFS